jgi:hypothetical protein
MASDARKHTVPVGTDPVDLVGVVGGLSASIRDIIQVDNTTARGALVNALTTAGIGPTATNPLYVHRSDAPVGRELERTTDGTNWKTLPAGGVLATAAGSVTAPNQAVGNTSNFSVTFPAGLFTTAPYMPNPNPSSSRITCCAVSITAAGCTIQASNWSPATSTGGPITWLAFEVA